MYEGIVLASVLNSSSTNNQFGLISKLFEENNILMKRVTTVANPELEKDDVLGAFWFQLASAPFIQDAVVPYLFSNKPRIVYVTIEGVPRKGNYIHTNIPRMKFTAVSKFVAKCLTLAGLKVERITHHAIDVQISKNAVKQSDTLRRQLENEYKERVKFLYVGRHDPRKGLKNLATAIKILNDKGLSDKFVVLLITNPEAEILFKDLPNTNLIKHEGSLVYADVLKFMASVDYGVFPSFAEGFGLPVLEQNSVGKPVVHAWFEPLSEFSSQDFNFVFDFIEIQPVKCGVTQDWLFHLYPPEYLAEMMADAIDVYYNNRKEYEEYCKKAMEHTKKWDYKKIYKPFVERFKA